MSNAIAGRVCLVTGASSGIGKALSLRLVQNGATVIMACRDPERGEAAVGEIQRLSEGRGAAQLLLVDMSSQRSIREAVSSFYGRYDRLDVLINNAGVLLFDEVMTEDGIEKTLATNFIGPFLLTNLLMVRLKSAPAARIVNVVSEGTADGQLAVERIEDTGDYRAVTAYSRSKQAEILWTYELAARLKDTTITANCFYPGLVRTNLGKSPYKSILRSFARTAMTTLLTFLFTPMEESVKIGVFLAAGRTNGMNGRFLIRRKDKVIAKAGYDGVAGARLWDLAERLTQSSTASCRGASPEPGHRVPVSAPAR
jgi:NAD(P)-dependent dehydrogenase (short-subunit alcohol dehydrogenase family)